MAEAPDVLAVVRKAEVKCLGSAADGYRFTVLIQRVGDEDEPTLYLTNNETDAPPLVLTIEEWRRLDSAVEICAAAVSADGGRRRKGSAA